MNKKAINWCILIALALIWGSSFILMKRGMVVYASDEVAALRIFIAFLVLTPLIFKHVKRVHLKFWPAFLGMGTLGNFLPAFLFTKAETVISSSLAGMLNSLTPLFTLLFGVLLFKVKTKLWNALGILIGFIGAIGLLVAGKEEDMSSNLSYGLFVVLATVFYALSVNIIKKFLNEVPSVTATVWALLFIGPLAGTYLFTGTHFVEHLQTHPQAVSSLGYICILAIFGTAVSVIIFNVLIRNTNALFASSVTYLIPIVAMCWGIFDGEAVLFQHFMWIVVILLGVYLVNKKPAHTSPPAPLLEKEKGD
ncbi:MAG TPA: EamA family transporter [Bacteroidia bacterium]|nr:EamA family transporter [Bacteroidia bacterium]